MGSPEQREASLRAAGERLSKNYPEAQRAGYVSDYVEILSKLNGQIDLLLNAFKSEATPIIVAHIPFNPKAVQDMLIEHLANIKSAINIFTQLSASLGDSAVRHLTLVALKRGLAASHAAAAELGRRNDARNKETLV